jgi:hypothetical protein
MIESGFPDGVPIASSSDSARFPEARRIASNVGVDDAQQLERGSGVLVLRDVQALHEPDPRVAR